MNIELVSVDVWNTLLKSNPNTRTERARSLIRYIYDREPSHIETQSIISAYKKASSEINAYELRKGLTIPFMRKHELAIINCGIDKNIINTEFYRSEIIVNNLLNNKPSLLNPRAVQIIKDWYSKTESQVLILSNTQFADAETLSLVLKSYDLDKEIKFIGSDQCQSCKPTSTFYSNAYGRVDMSKVLHIGDDYALDILPVKKLKGNTYQIKNADSWNSINLYE